MAKTKNPDGDNALPQFESAKYWIDELCQALAREKDFRTEGREVLEIYQGKKVKTTPFNILYSNTETLSPALYNQKPRPVVKRRYDDADPVAREAAIMLRRGLEYMIDDINPAETGFSEAMVAAVTAALLPGRGTTYFRYNAEVELDENGQPKEVTYEDIEIEEVPWDGFVHGYATRWRDVPWCGFRQPAATRAELIKMFGPDIGKAIPVNPPKASDADDGDDNAKLQDVPKDSWVAEIWMVWCKTSKKVYWIAKEYPDKILKIEEPKTNFKGFYPCPRPLKFFNKLGDLSPRSLYSVYRQQAEEINQMTRRIMAIIKALKVRGAYDSSISDFDRILEAEENKLIPITNAAQLYAQGGGFDKAVWLWPIEKLQSTLVTLYQEREAAKQTLYEITGIADIMRGSSVASETLGAQQIKTQWGTMRLKRMQAEASRYVRDCLRLMAEILAENFTPESLKAMTNTILMPQAAKQQLQLQMQAAPGVQPPPEVQQALNLPSLDEVQALLKNEMDRCYRIDIESNSTVDVEATEDKEMIGEALNAIAQFLNGVGPLVAQGALPMGVAKSILMSICRRFRFGEEVERAIEAMPEGMQQPPQQGDQASAPKEDPAVIQAQQQADQSRAQTTMLVEQQKQRTIQMDLEYREAEHAFKMQELVAKSAQLTQAGAVATVTHQQKMKQAAMPPKPAARPQGK